MGSSFCPGCGAARTADPEICGDCARKALREVGPCPACAGRMLATSSDLGRDVECPYCLTIFRAFEAPVVLHPEEPVKPVRREEKRSRAEIEQPKRDDSSSERVIAGVLALVLGSIGVHKFYLGYTAAGFIQLGLTILTCGAAKVIPLAEGIIYLSRSDQEFIKTYQKNRREWF